MALSEAAKECVLPIRILKELVYPSEDVVSLATDNSGARDLAYNPEHHHRVKHIECRHFYVRELVEDHKLVVPYVSTVDNMADYFTMPLPAATLYRMRTKIMNIQKELYVGSSIPFRARGVLNAGPFTLNSLCHLIHVRQREHSLRLLHEY